MNTVQSLILILALSSLYDQLPSLLAVEARNKLNSNGGTFTVDLIHRESLLSPKEHKKRLPFGSVSRGHRTNLFPSEYYEKNDIETELTPSGGGYLMKIAIGTPPIEFLADADTGSDLIWLQCTPCQVAQSCIPQQSPLFDPTKSSTYEPLSCNSPSCSNSDLTTECAVNNTNKTNEKCAYLVVYGGGLISIGVLSTDTITFPSADVSVTLPSSVFGCGYAQNGSLAKGDGIIGLGAGPSSLVSQLGPKINHKFSYCLVPLSSGATSKLRFGADLTGLSGVVSTPFVTKDPPVFYYLTLDGISIGDSLVKVGQDIIIDSGTTLTYLETNVYDGVRDALKNAIELSPISDPQSPLLCYETQLSSLNPPDVAFHFEGADVVLKAINIFRQIEDIACLAMLPTKGTHFIFGNIAQVNFEVGYDLQAKQVSFAPTDCTKY